MKILGTWSITSFINFCVQLMWAGVLVALCLMPLALIFQFFGLSMVLIPLPVNLEITAEIMKQGQQLAVFPDAMSTTYYPALLEEESLNWAMILLNVFQMMGLGFILYGISQLKDVLRNLIREKPFADNNHSKLRSIAIMIMLMSPLFYAYQWLSYWVFKSYIQTESLQAAYPGFDLSYIIMGLIVLVIAEIFRQATEIHKEQKLTV